MYLIYARVSTDDKGQTPENQLREIFLNIPPADPRRTYIETQSATKYRPEWERLLAEAQGGDTILVWKLDRAFRSVSDAARVLGLLRARGIEFRAVTEGWDTKTAGGRLMYNLLASFAEFERDVLAERTRAGMARARANGKHVGRPRRGMVPR